MFIDYATVKVNPWAPWHMTVVHPAYHTADSDNNNSFRHHSDINGRTIEIMGGDSNQVNCRVGIVTDKPFLHPIPGG